MIVLNTPSTRHQKRLAREAKAQAERQAFLERNKKDEKSENDATKEPKDPK
jgi:hypothetical protein